MELKKFSLSISLPLADIYNRAIATQDVKLSNYSVVSENEFEFTSLSLYNFMVNEETFNHLSAADLVVTIDEMDISGKFKMNKLLLAPGFKLALQVPLTKTTVLESVQPKKTAEQKKEELLQAKKGRKNLVQIKADQAKKARENMAKQITTHAGYLEVELNL